MKKFFSHFTLFLIFTSFISAQTTCFTGSEEFPGCLFKCENYSGKFSAFDYDIQSPCDMAPASSQWFSLIAKGGTIKIELDTLLYCSIGSGFRIQVYEQPFQPFSPCTIFQDSDIGKSMTVSGLTIGDEYSVRIIRDSFSSNCTVNLSIEGNEIDTLGEIDSIYVDQSGQFPVYEIDSVPGAKNYEWIAYTADSIISGQGTRRVEVDWGTNTRYSICVTADNNCKKSRQKCLSFPAIPLPPCLPIAGGIPAGNNAPGCTLCGPVYQGSTEGYEPSAPGSDGFPCGTIENNQFISITADASGTLQATIIASNCLNSQGVQLVIYDQFFNPVSNCYSSGGVNLPGNVTATGLTPGETYWIMIDGFAGDICDILLTTSGGINTGPPDPPGPITAVPDTTPLCPGAIVCYSIDDVSGATEYEWVPAPNAVIVSGGGPNDTEVCLEFVSAGGGVVRVTPSNPCFSGIPAVKPVVVVPILPTIKSPEAICLSDFPITRDGNIFNEPGNHQVTYQTKLGCDSVVTYLFIPNVQIPNVLDTTICRGDCVQVGFDCYDEPITQTITLGPPFQQTNGCDSIVILNINYIEPRAIINYFPPFDCASGDLIYLGGDDSSSEPYTTYEWSASNGGRIAGPTDQINAQGDRAGTYYLTVTQTDSLGTVSCSAVDSVIVQSTSAGPSSDFSIISPICVGEPTTVTYQGSVSPSTNFDWEFPNGTILSGSGSGPYEITYDVSGANEISLTVTEGNCISDKNTQNIVVNDELGFLGIDCASTTNSIDFNWNDVQGATNYHVEVLSGHTGTQLPTGYSVTGLNPNEAVTIEVTASGHTGCGIKKATRTCEARDCQVIQVNIDPIPDICLNQNASVIALTATAAQNAGVFTWSGPGVSAPNVFNPSVAGIGTHTIEVMYSEGGCDYFASANINISAPPNAEFTATSPICLFDHTELTYNGTASPFVTFIWDFGNGIVRNGSNSGPYEIQFPTDGTYPISLIVVDGGCASDPFTQNIIVDAPLTPPLISCTSALNSVNFEWNADPAVTEYTVSLNGTSFNQSSTEFEVSGLSPGEEVTIELTANSNNACGPVTSRASCIAQNCPNANLIIDQIGPFCEESDINFQATSSISGDPDNGVGTYTWSGHQGLDSTGNFSSSGLPVGNYPVYLTYESVNNCSYSAIGQFQVVEPPRLSADILAPIWFPGTSGDIDVTTSAGTTPYQYIWSDGSDTEDLTDIPSDEEFCVTVSDGIGCTDTDCYEVGSGIYRITPVHLICKNDSKRVSVRPGRGADFRWFPSDGLSCDNCPNPTISPSKSTIYNIEATMPDGRMDTTQIIVLALPPIFCQLAQSVDPMASFNSDFDFSEIKEDDLEELESMFIFPDKENAVQIFPNPTTGIINISSTSMIESVNVYDLSGKEIHKETNHRIDLSAFAKGIYFMKINTGEESILKKVILF